MSENEIFVTWLLEHTGYNGDLFGGPDTIESKKITVYRPNTRLTFQGPPVDAPPMWPNVGDAYYYMHTY